MIKYESKTAQKVYDKILSDLHFEVISFIYIKCIVKLKAKGHSNNSLCDTSHKDLIIFI